MYECWIIITATWLHIDYSSVKPSQISLNILYYSTLSIAVCPVQGPLAACEGRVGHYVIHINIHYLASFSLLTNLQS